MTRITGSINKTDYKYSVEELNEDGTIKNKSYFISQKEIQHKFNLKRSAVYFHIHNKEMRKTKDNINIIKLSEPMPVFNKEIYEENGDNIVAYRKLKY